MRLNQVDGTVSSGGLLRSNNQFFISSNAFKSAAIGCYILYHDQWQRLDIDCLSKDTTEVAGTIAL